MKTGLQKMILNGVLVAGSLFAFTGCYNVTSQSLCQQKNIEKLPEGMTGFYEINIQDFENFKMESTEVRIYPSDDSSKKFQVMKFDDDENISYICNIQGQLVMEDYNKELQGYEQKRLFVSQVGLHSNKIGFDPQKLEDLKIPYKIIEVPETVRSILGVRLSHKIETLLTKVGVTLGGDSAWNVLMIDNNKVDAHTLLQAAKPLSVGFTMFRK